MLKKNNIGKIATIGFGAALLGATAFGLGAASLSDFPAPFVQGKSLNSVVIFGDDAQNSDQTGANQIRDYFSTLTGGRTSGAVASQLSLSSNSFLIEERDDSYVELGDFAESSEFLGGPNGGFTFDIDGGDLAILADGDLNDNAYEQSVRLGNSTTEKAGTIIYEEQSDVLDTFLKYSTGDTIFTYKVDFRGSGATSSFNSEGVLEDFIDEDITILGRTYTVVEAKVGNAENEVKFVLSTGSERVNAKASSTVTIGGKSVQIGVIYTDPREVDITVGGETETVSAGETAEFADGFELAVRSIRTLGNEGAGSVEIDYDADTIELDSGVDSTATTDNVKVEIDGRLKPIGADFSVVSTGNTSGGDAIFETTISSFEIKFKAHEDYFILPSNGLQTVDSDGNAFLRDGVANVLGDLNIVYRGLSEEETQDVVFSHSDGGDHYELSFVDGDGNTVEVPLVYSDDENEDEFRLGNRDNKLVINASDVTSDNNLGQIGEDDYFLLSDSNDKKTYLLKLVSAEYNTDDKEGVFVVRNIGSGEETTIETGQLTTSSTGVRAKDLAGGIDGSLDAKLDGSNNPFLGLNSASNKIYLSNGQEITITTTKLGDSPDNSNAVVRTIVATFSSSSDTRIFDDEGGGDIKLTFSGTVEATDGNPGGSPLSLTIDRESSLKTDPDNNDLKTGYNAFGTFVTVDSSNDDGKVVTLTTPDKQIRPWVVLEGAPGASSTVSVGDSSGSTSVATARPASSIGNYQDFNTILVGGPCVNPFTAQALGSSGECTDGFTEGSAIIQYVPHTNGNVALVVAGYSASDTTRAVNVLTQSTRDEGLTGTKVTVTPNPSGSGVVVSPAQ